MSDVLKVRDKITREWQSILAIKGDKGDTGAQGPKGDTGQQGPKGDKGDDGAALIDDTKTEAESTWSSQKINQNLSNLNSALASKANTSDIPSLSGYATQSWVEGKGYLTECRANIETEVPSDDEFLPNVYYQFDELEELYIALAEPTDETHLNEYMVEFVSGATATNFSYDITSITFMSEPTIEANKKYQISIVNGIGLLVGVAYE